MLLVRGAAWLCQVGNLKALKITLSKNYSRQKINMLTNSYSCTSGFMHWKHAYKTFTTLAKRFMISLKTPFTRTKEASKCTKAKIEPWHVDCSQYPIFPCDRRCGYWPLMRAKLGIVQNASGWEWWRAQPVEKIGTVTASLCLVFKGRGRILAPPLIKSINILFPGEKSLSNQGNIMLITCCCTVSRHFD